jgi:hypothetical protein
VVSACIYKTEAKGIHAWSATAFGRWRIALRHDVQRNGPFVRSSFLYIQGSDQRHFSIPIVPRSGIRIAQVGEAANREAKDFKIRRAPCSSLLPRFEVPINTMVTCLEVEPRRLNVLRMQLATVLRGSPATPARLKRIKRPCGRGARTGKTMVVLRGTRRMTRLVSGA